MLKKSLNAVRLPNDTAIYIYNIIRHIQSFTFNAHSLYNMRTSRRLQVLIYELWVAFVVVWIVIAFIICYIILELVAFVIYNGGEHKKKTHQIYIVLYYLN